MFPLAGNEFPTRSEELAAAIEAALGDVFTLPTKGPAVAVEGVFPDLKEIAVDLDGAGVKPGTLPEKPVGVGQRKPGVTVDILEISGHPIRYRQAALELDLSASGLTFDFDRDSSGRPLLVLTRAKAGQVNARISKADIESLLLEAATLAARQQGVTIKDLALGLTSDGPRSVAAAVRVTAKKMMMTGVIHLTGQLEIDDQLNATASSLRCTGEGIVGSAAAAILQKKIAPFNGARIPLMAFSLGDVTLRDLKITLTDSLQVTTAFGSDVVG